MTASQSSLATSVRSTKFNPAINGFRGLCVLMVFAYHVFNSGLLPTIEMVSAPLVAIQTAITFFASSWRYGVELFFMISGYVIVASLRRHGSVAAFLRDRCIRIFPVWIPVCMAVFGVGVAIGWKIFGELNMLQLSAVFGANLLLLPPLLPIPLLHPASWSLSYEWVFYLLAAAAFALSTTRHGGYRLSVAVLTWIVTTLGLLWYLPRGLFFLPGVVLALGWLPLDKYRGLLRWPWLSMLVLLLSWRAVNLDQAEPGAYPMLLVLASYKSFFMLLALLAGLHLMTCICAGERGTAWLCRPAVQLLGTISYSFYLWHPIVMFAVKPIAKRLIPSAGAWLATAAFALLSFAVALLWSWMSYRLFEHGVAHALRRKFERPRSVTVLASAEPQPVTLGLSEVAK